MCGIAGIFHYDKNRTVNESVLKRMTNLLIHRGPDGEGYYIDKNIGLGHRRLSIIDIETGDQPIYNERGDIIIIFNGEIYNYIELRDELKNSGHVFKTNSDTETIIHAYEEWGYDCQNRLNGMWAFAIWDGRKNELFISRDRAGEKPLYFSTYDNTFLFSSEIKSILSSGAPAEKNMELLEIYLSLGFLPAPFTFYKNIHKLNPGHYLVVKDGNFHKHRFWDFTGVPEEEFLKNGEEVYQNFEYLLKDSVRLRMRSDVPYGAFLSGGLDSASMVALMSEILDKPVNTFTMGFEEKIYDERSMAREVSDRFKTKHNELVLSPDTIDESIEKIIRHYDEPFGDPTAIPTGYLSEFARQRVKMVLTGDGGDEILSGYTIYQGEKFAGLYSKLPGYIRKSIPAAISKLSLLTSGRPRYSLNRIHSIAESSSLSFIDRLIIKSSAIETGILKKLIYDIHAHPIEDFFHDMFRECNYKDNFYRLMFYNLRISLPDNMLAKVDMMTMASSIEARVPFLDYRLIEFMSRIDKNVKLQGFERKAVLKKTIGKKLPSSVLNSPKKGFAVPTREWFKDKSFNDKIRDLTDFNWNLDKKTLVQILDQNKTGKKDYGNFIWMLLVLKKWMQG